MNLYFRNASLSPATAYAPAWQDEIRQRVANDYSDQARKVNAEFRAKVLEALTPENALAGLIVRDIAAELPRFAYIKNIDNGDGKLYDAEIDLLGLTVDFREI